MINDKQLHMIYCLLMMISNEQSLICFLAKVLSPISIVLVLHCNETALRANALPMKCKPLGWCKRLQLDSIKWL